MRLRPWKRATTQPTAAEAVIHDAELIVYQAMLTYLIEMIQLGTQALEHGLLTTQERDDITNALGVAERTLRHIGVLP